MSFSVDIVGLDGPASYGNSTPSYYHYPTLKQVFGSTAPISKILKDTSSTFQTGLAPAFGTLYSDGIKSINKELQIILSTSLRKIETIPIEYRTFEEIDTVLKSNPVLVYDPQCIDKTDRITKSGTNAFKVDGSPDQSIVREIETWFRKLISNEDVMRTTQIDIKVLGKIVAETGATVKSFETLFAAEESESKTVVDIGILRFPDLDHPYIQLYYIKLVAWRHSKRVLFVQEDSNGIIGYYKSRTYRPNAAKLAQMTAPARALAIKEAEHIFD